MRILLDAVGWAALSPAERQAAINGGVLGGGSVMALYALFGYRHLRHQWRGRKRKRGSSRRKGRR